LFPAQFVERLPIQWIIKALVENKIGFSLFKRAAAAFCSWASFSILVRLMAIPEINCARSGYRHEGIKTINF
jgi:hypothetical protein